MNNTGNHNIPWSDTDIRKYLQGELSAREMHELEKAALEDPFLADALEGLETSPSPEADMDQLRLRLDARLEKKEETHVIAWWRRPGLRIAAAAVLIMGVAVTALSIYFTSGKARLNVDLVRVDHYSQPAASQPAAKSTTATADSSAIASDSTAGYYAANEKKTPVKIQSEVARNTNLKKEVERQPARRAAAPAIAPIADSGKSSTIDDRSVAAETRPAQPVDGFVKKDNAPDKDLTMKADSLQIADIDKAKELKRAYYSINKPLTFSGRVVDNNNRPLAGALLSVNGYSNVGAKTDVYGNFKFRMRPADSNQQLTIALNGYKQTNVSLSTNALNNNIYQLQPSAPELNEVVITGYGSKRKETLAAAPLDDNNERLDSVWLRVYPIIGKLAYQEYLDSAKKALRLDSAIHGQERVSFEVDQKGLISAFKIEQSLSPVHDAGVIQVINGGPAWKLLRGKKARALVILNFP